MYLLAVCDAAAADQLRDRLKELGESVAIAAAPPDSYPYTSTPTTPVPPWKPDWRWGELAGS